MTTEEMLKQILDNQQLLLDEIKSLRQEMDSKFDEVHSAEAELLKNQEIFKMYAKKIKHDTGLDLYAGIKTLTDLQLINSRHVIAAEMKIEKLTDKLL